MAERYLLELEKVTPEKLAEELRKIFEEVDRDSLARILLPMIDSVLSDLRKIAIPVTRAERERLLSYVLDEIKKLRPYQIRSKYSRCVEKTGDEEYCFVDTVNYYLKSAVEKALRRYLSERITELYGW